MRVATREIGRPGRHVRKEISTPRRMEPTLTREFEAIFMNNGMPMVIVEEDATISLVNAEFVRLSGYTKAEIEGKKSWMEFVARDDRRWVKEYHRLCRTDPLLSPRCFEFGSSIGTGRSRTSCSPSGRSPERTRTWHPCWMSPIASRRRQRCG